MHDIFQLLNTILASIGLSFHQTCENQCVFVRGYRISVRSGLFTKSGKSVDVVFDDGANSEDASHSTKDKDIPFFDRGNRPWFRGIRNGAVLGWWRHVSNEPVENQEIAGDRDEAYSGEDIVIEADPAAPNVSSPADHAACDQRIPASCTQCWRRSMTTCWTRYVPIHFADISMTQMFVCLRTQRHKSLLHTMMIYYLCFMKCALHL